MNLKYVFLKFNTYYFINTDQPIGKGDNFGLKPHMINQQLSGNIVCIKKALLSKEQGFL